MSNDELEEDEMVAGLVVAEEETAKRAFFKRPAAEIQANIDEMAREMVEGRWIRGVSNQRWKEKLGMSRSTVARLSHVASRMVWDATKQQKAERAATTLVQLDRIALKAEKDRRYKDAVMALTEANTISGLRVEPYPVSVSIYNHPQGAELLEQLAKELCPECAGKMLRLMGVGDVVDTEGEEVE